MSDTSSSEAMLRAASRPRDKQPTADIPPEVQAELVHAMLDRQYRALLDEPVAMLGGVSPRAAARSAKGRRALAAWLKHLENRSGNASGHNDPMATYDYSNLRLHLAVAGTQGRTTAELTGQMAISHSFAVTGPS